MYIWDTHNTAVYVICINLYVHDFISRVEPYVLKGQYSTDQKARFTNQYIHMLRQDIWWNTFLDILQESYDFLVLRNVWIVIS